MEFPINKLMTNITKMPCPNLSPAPFLAINVCVVSVFFFRCKWPRSHKVQKFHLQTCNWKNPHTHRTHMSQRAKVKHVGIFCVIFFFFTVQWRIFYSHKKYTHRKSRKTKKDTYESQRNGKCLLFQKDYNIEEMPSWRIFERCCDKMQK